MLQTPGPEGPLSGALAASVLFPQFRIGFAGVRSGLLGSSIIKSTSLKFRFEFVGLFKKNDDVILLVMLVFRNTVMLTCGTGCPGGVGTPPLQVNTMSPVRSV